MPGLTVDACSSKRLDLSRYDRTPVLTVREQMRIAAVAEGESLHLRLDDPLARFWNRSRLAFVLPKRISHSTPFCVIL